MTKSGPIGEQIVFPGEGDEYLAGGIEPHARIVEEGGSRELTLPASLPSVTGKFLKR